MKHPEILDALRMAAELIAADIVRDDAGCLSKIRAAIAKTEEEKETKAIIQIRGGCLVAVYSDDPKLDVERWDFDNLCGDGANEKDNPYFNDPDDTRLEADFDAVIKGLTKVA